MGMLCKVLRIPNLTFKIKQEDKNVTEKTVTAYRREQTMQSWTCRGQCKTMYNSFITILSVLIHCICLAILPERIYLAT